MSFYDEYFSIKITELKTTGIQSPWITTGIKKLLKHKKCLYEKFSKTRCKKTKDAYKNYKLFEHIKQRAKRVHFSNLRI